MAIAYKALIVALMSPRCWKQHLTGAKLGAEWNFLKLGKDNNLYDYYDFQQSNATIEIVGNRYRL